jgi:hypothetical protein
MKLGKKNTTHKSDSKIMDDLLRVLHQYSLNEKLGVPEILQWNALILEKKLPEIIGIRQDMEAVRRRILHTLELHECVGKYPHKITEKGSVFILNGGYEYQEYQQKLDLKIKQESLTKFKYDKWAFFLSIVAIIVSIVAVFVTYYS